MFDEDLLYFTLPLILSGLAGGGAMWLYYSFKIGSLTKFGNELTERSERKAELILKDAHLKAEKEEAERSRTIEERFAKERQKAVEREERIKEREDKLEARLLLVEKKLRDIDRREAILEGRREKQEIEKQEIAKEREKLLADIEKLGAMSRVEAKEELLKLVRQDVALDAARYTKTVREETERDAERIASSIIATAINRLALPTVSELAIMTVPLPGDEMKGRIIGREGRNIRALERATGVNFLVDETPGVVVISSFDPIRKLIAKLALSDLINDGRIHPTRIEEAVEKARSAVQKQLRRWGEDAALRIGAPDIHPELLDLLGKLKCRLSYGQNVLDHSLEVAHLMGMMATELGLNVQLARRIGLLHDIGKAVSHEVEGTHALIGRDLALRYGETAEVANGIGCHHEEIAPITPEAALSSIGDRLSGGRPGARVEAVEEYYKRLKKLEDIAKEFPGIEEVFALQAGREVRVVVLPEMIDDAGIVNLARDLTKKIGALDFGGKIKVTVIREKRAVEYAI